MSTDNLAPSTDRSDPVTGEELPHAQPIRGELHRWLPILLGPIAFLLDQLSSYYLVHPICDTHQQWALYLPPVGSLLLTTIAFATAWVQLPRGPETPDFKRERARFLGQFGVALSAFSFVAIVALNLPKFIFGACDV
jgi:hypothetical protein